MFYINTMVQSVGSNYYNPYYDYSSLQQQRRQNIQSENPLLSIGGLLLASQGIRWLSDKASKTLIRGKEYTTAANVSKVANAMLKNNNLGVDVFFVNPNNIDTVSHYSRIPVESLREVASGKNAFYADSIKVAVAPSTKPSLIQHELGHAINAKNKFLKLLQNSRSYVTVIPTTLLLLNYLIKNRQNNNNREDTFIEKNAGVLGFLAYAPTIAEEGLASIRGINAAKRTLKGQKINFGPLRKNYLFAWLTYLLAGVGLGVASKLSIKTGLPMTLGIM